MKRTVAISPQNCPQVEVETVDLGECNQILAVYRLEVGCWI